MRAFLLLVAAVLSVAAAQRFGRPQLQPRPGPGHYGPGQGPGYSQYGEPGDGGALGAACDYDEDCYSVEHTYCRAQQTCECKRGFKPSLQMDRCMATVGARCNTRYDCAGLGPSAECRQGVCDCSPDSVPAPDGSCLKGALKMNEPCKENKQCESLGSGVVCADDRCQCALGRHAHNDKCYANRGLHQPCNDAAECYIGEGYQSVITCHMGTCRCREHYIDRGDGVCESGAEKVTMVTSYLVLALLLSAMVLR